MDQEKITRLLAAAGAEPVRSPPCPDEHALAGYADGGLDAAVRREVELHLAECSHCVALAALLVSERDVDRVEPVHELPATRPNGATQRRWHSAPQWAAAAAIVLAVPVFVSVIGRPGIDESDSPPPAATRTLAPADIGLQVLPATAGATDRRLQFRWTEVADTPFYDLRIVTDHGDVVIRERLTGTSWTVPSKLRLRPGAEYFVHVEAYPSGDKVLSSDHVAFRIPD